MIKNKINFIVYLIFFLCIAVNHSNAQNTYSNLTNDHEIIAKYENGGKGYEAIGKDNYGGCSYGKWQISTKRGKNGLSTFDSFLSYLNKNNHKYYTKLMNAGGYESAFSGDEAFISTWKAISKEKEFTRAYDNFILDTQIIPAYEMMEKCKSKDFDIVVTWGLNDNVVQAAIHSMIIQHGPYGSFKLIKRAIEREKLTTKENFLKVVYNTRKDIYPKYIRRYNNEYNDLVVSMSI